MATNNVVNNASPYIPAHEVVISEGPANQVGVLLGAGQVLIGTTASDPVAGTIAGSGTITVTSTTGAITISSTGVGGLMWNDVPGTTQAAVVNNGYIISNAGQTTVTIPATAAEGSVIAISGKGAGGWVMQMNTGQVCHLGNASTTSAGSITSTNLYDCISILCVTANTTWVVQSAIGNLTLA